MRQTYASTSSQGLDMTSLPWRLYDKAKIHFWNPAAIDFSQDVKDWKALTDREREYVTHLASLFMTGEEAVTLDIVPLLKVMCDESRIEEAMFLTTFAFEEAKHLEFFRRFFDAVGVAEDLSGYQTPNYQLIFNQHLPEALGRLSTDPSPANQAIAAVTYNHVIEGVLALTGYHAWGKALSDAQIFPGLAEGLKGVQKDERRHMAYGTYLCRRLVANDRSIWEVIQQRIEELTLPALGMIDEGFERYEGDRPFGIGVEDLLDYAMTQFPRRLEVIEAALGKTESEVQHDTVSEDLEEELEFAG